MKDEETNRKEKRGEYRVPAVNATRGLSWEGYRRGTLTKVQGYVTSVTMLCSLRYEFLSFGLLDCRKAYLLFLLPTARWADAHRRISS
eukprot:scaffold893_cov143-Skeletonema_marinoi.AAC.6